MPSFYFLGIDLTDLQSANKYVESEKMFTGRGCVTHIIAYLLSNY